MIFIRQDPLTGDWVSLNADRQQRPLTAIQSVFCPFCPGERTEVGMVPFDVAVFENKFPAFHNPGSAEVVVYSPGHDDDLAYLPGDRAWLVWNAWKDRTQDLMDHPDVKSVIIFENRGAKVGASIAHPHGQIYAYPYLPSRLWRERSHFLKTCLLCPSRGDTGIVLFADELWRIEVPSAMRMPYQTRLVPNRHVHDVAHLRDDEVQRGSTLMQEIVRTYDSYFGLRTALVMALYQDISRGSSYHLRWDFLPIDRGPGKIKYLAGSELAMDAFVVDMTPEFVWSELDPIFRQIHDQKGTK